MREEEFLVATVKRMNGVYSDEVVDPEYQLNRIRSVLACRKLGYVFLLNPGILYSQKKQKVFETTKNLKKFSTRKKMKIKTIRKKQPTEKI